MDALEPFPLFKSVIGLEVPSGERCHNDTSLLHNIACRQSLPASLNYSVLMLMLWMKRVPGSPTYMGNAAHNCRTPVVVFTAPIRASRVTSSHYTQHSVVEKKGKNARETKY